MEENKGYNLNHYAFMGVSIMSTLPNDILDKAIQSICFSPEFLEWHKKELANQFKNGGLHKDK